ncbi:MAG: abortive infection family protein [Myxococcota bacterium]
MADAVFHVNACLTSRATGEHADDGEYVRLRKVLLAEPALAGRLPNFLQRCRTLDEFWAYIKAEFERYAERRAHIARAFAPLLDDLESGHFGASGVKLQAEVTSADPISHEFIRSQVTKCNAKLASGDYDGAITNARALIEGVLREMELRLDPTPPPTDGDLIKQYKRVQRLLHLDPASTGVGTPLQQVLTGLSSVVSGLAGLRNALSDAHVRSHRPGAHHARLVVNAAMTLANFLFDTFEYQRANGKLVIVGGNKLLA